MSLRTRIELLVALAALAAGCSGPRIAGTSVDGSYRPPSQRWSVDLPFEESICLLQDEQFPLQENARFSPELPFGLGVFQIAVTHNPLPATEGHLSDKDAWFTEVIDGLDRAGNTPPRLLASEVLSGPDEIWMRAYATDAHLHLFLLRPVPALKPGEGAGAVLFCLSNSYSSERNRVGDEPPLPLPMRWNWGQLVEWSESFVWRASADRSD